MSVTHSIATSQGPIVEEPVDGVPPFLASCKPVWTVQCSQSVVDVHKTHSEIVVVNGIQSAEVDRVSAIEGSIDLALFLHPLD